MNFASIRKRIQSLSWLRRRPDDRARLGRRGERAAALFLKRRRHRIIVRNFRAPMGEIDLVTTSGDTIVFVEVKTRSAGGDEDPAGIVRKPQWDRIERAARFFLRTRSAEHRPCRFDLVTVSWPRRGAPHVEHFADVHQATHV